MTKIYLGANLYEIHLGHQKFTFSGDELDELNEENVDKIEELEKENEDFFDIVEDLETKISELDDVVSDLERQIVELIEEKALKYPQK